MPHLTEPIIFPTLYRSKSPKALAFPAGAEALSAALGTGHDTMKNISKSPFAIKNKTGHVLCPVCGHAGTFDEQCFNERGGVIGSGICPCCMYEPGFDDNPEASAKAKATPLASIKHYRAEWIEEGMPWRSGQESKPDGWNAADELANLLKLAPGLG
jgi:hypothetical protein